jgi:hypothetical protein
MPMYLIDYWPRGTVIVILIALQILSDDIPSFFLLSFHFFFCLVWRRFMEISVDSIYLFGSTTSDDPFTMNCKYCDGTP